MKLINLFSVFDPSRYFSCSLNWLSIFIPLIFCIFTYWIINNKLNLLFYLLNLYHIEIKILLGGLSKGKSILFITLLMFIIPINFFGLYPYIFTFTRHISLTLSLALPLWLSSLLFGITKALRPTVSHLIPSGTSYPLAPFIALAELIRIRIRPITLGIRLATNIIAGHLLLRLLRGQGYTNLLASLKGLIILTQILLIALEVGVRVVQSYVFSTLSLLYLSEW